MFKKFVFQKFFKDVLTGAKLGLRFIPMLIDALDLKIIRAIENGGKIFQNNLAPILAEPNLKNEDIVTRLSRIESEQLIKDYKTTICVPRFMGGDWALSCALGITNKPENTINQISQKLPFVIEIIQNVSLPEGYSPNFSVLFYTKEFPTSQQFLKEFDALSYVEIYKLREYSYPIPPPLTVEEKKLLLEIYKKPTVQFQELSQLFGQDLVWIKTKVLNLVSNPENLENDSSNEIGFIQILPEIDWSDCENFRHIHFLVEKNSCPNLPKNNEFQLVLSGQSFRGKFCQIENDIWGYNQLVAKLNILKQAGINIHGIILAQSNHVINQWVRKLII